MIDDVDDYFQFYSSDEQVHDRDARLTQVTVCKGRYDDLLDNIDRWLATSIDELLIVDWGCPDGTSDKLLHYGYIGKGSNITLLKVDEAFTGPFMSLGRAYNVGARFSENDNLLFVPADTWVDKGTVSTIKNNLSACGIPIFVSASLKNGGAVFNYENGINKLARTGVFGVVKSLYFRVGGLKSNLFEWSSSMLVHDFVRRATKCILADEDLLSADLECFDDDVVHHTDHDNVVRSRFMRTAVPDDTSSALLFLDLFVSNYLRGIREPESDTGGLLRQRACGDIPFGVYSVFKDGVEHTRAAQKSLN